MRRFAFLSLTLTFLLLAAPALACHFEGVVPMADCEGWSIQGVVVFGGGDTEAEVTWSVTLHDSEGMVAEYGGMETLYEADGTFDHGGMWEGPLCGDYTAYLEVSLVSASSTDMESYEISFTCECDEPEVCTWTPGYWKNHADAWPVMELTVGCEDYGQMELMDIFGWPTRGDMTVKLFHHLVAAKLNILVSGDDSMDEVIGMADDFLCDHPLGSRPEGEWKDMAEDLKDQLCWYNEYHHCEDDDGMDWETGVMDYSTTPTKDSTWGAVKAGYR